MFVCVIRVLIGFTQGTVYPCTHTLLAKWVPRQERGFLSCIVYSGAEFGTALLLAISGSIFDSEMGWPGIFYITGAIGIVWSLVFLIFGADSPRNTKFISEAEKKYIECSTGSDNQQINGVSIEDEVNFSVFTLLNVYICGFNHNSVP